MIAAMLLAAAQVSGPPTVTVARDNVTISRTCHVRIAVPLIRDTDGNGVLQITGHDIEVTFETPLRGAAPGDAPDAYMGTGLHITGRNVTIRGAAVHGFRCGIHATGADGLTLVGADVSDNFRQHLRSTPLAEDAADWLWPHANDANEWLDHYGAGIYVEDASDITIRRTFARNVQNGIILDRVNDARVYDNDCSFLSGWGIAMWRSSDNIISRNALDFCVRGYSHGVYNRGQDSAGLLMFEQCSNNVIVENSITHGGDGLFLFAGAEALGQTPPEGGPPAEADWYAARGSNANLVTGNDLSDCVAHGAELTFSFDNRLVGNRFANNGICGIWGGYSRDMYIANNTFSGNGAMGGSLERGAINIEHGSDNLIVDNRFDTNACGVALWWDEDAALLELPWAKRNGAASHGNMIAGNSFDGDAVGIQLRATTATQLGANDMRSVAVELDADAASDVQPAPELPGDIVRRYEPLGQTHPAGARAALQGREHIVMTEWGPHDGVSPALRLVRHDGGAEVYELLGVARRIDDEAISCTGADLQRDGATVTITSPDPARATPYHLIVRVNDGPPLERRGVLFTPTWELRAFAWTIDPREDADAWRADAANGVTSTRGDLSLVFAGNGPAQLGLGDGLPRDHFGTLASTKATLPAGNWQITTRSDDGIRVWLDGELVIDDWTWHAPTTHDHAFTLDAEKTIELRVEHFELDGYAVLEVGVDGAEAVVGN